MQWDYFDGGNAHTRLHKDHSGTTCEVVFSISHESICTIIPAFAPWSIEEEVTSGPMGLTQIAKTRLRRRRRRRLSLLVL